MKMSEHIAGTSAHNRFATRARVVCIKCVAFDDNGLLIGEP
jgi:hypothetical protein